jgi:hypothetical protein
MTVGLSTVNLANSMLDTLRNVSGAKTTVNVKLHTADPGAAGATAASAETTRKAVTFNAASGGAIALSTSVSWTAWSAGNETITHVSVWDNISVGNFLFSAALSPSKSVTNGDTLTLTALGLSLTPLAS